MRHLHGPSKWLILFGTPAGWVVNVAHLAPIFPFFFHLAAQDSLARAWDSRIGSTWCGTSSSSASIAGQPQRPLNNEMYSAFKSGNVVKGILCPSLTNSFKQSSLERSYLTYTHRQRQKSLIIVNVVDFVLSADHGWWADYGQGNRNRNRDSGHILDRNSCRILWGKLICVPTHLG